MKYWRIEIINNKKKESRLIEAVDFSKERIKEIFKEVHSEWDIKKIVSVDSIPKKEGENKNG